MASRLFNSQYPGAGSNIASNAMSKVSNSAKTHPPALLARRSALEAPVERERAWVCVFALEVEVNGHWPWQRTTLIGGPNKQRSE